MRQGSLWNTFIPDFLLLKPAYTQASPVFQHPPAWQEFCPGFELLLSFAYALCKWIMILVSKMPYQSWGLHTPGQSLFITVASECSRGAAQTPAVWVGWAQEWRKCKLLMSFSTPSLCKEIHISGKALLCLCTNKIQKTSLSPFLFPLANILPEPHLISSDLETQGLLTWTSPLYSSKDKNNPAQQILLVTSDLFLPGVFPPVIFPRPAEQHLSWDCSEQGNPLSSTRAVEGPCSSHLLSPLSSVLFYLFYRCWPLCCKSLHFCSPASKALQQQLLLN